MDRYLRFFSEEEFRESVSKLNNFLAEKSIVQEILHLDKEFNFGDIYGDSTCVETYVHYPVDWLLIRDAVRTITKSLDIIRRDYFKIRMPLPSSYLKTINTLCIEMVQCKRTKNSKKTRKKVYRKMKKVLLSVANHGQKYSAELEKIEGTKARGIQQRIDGILVQVSTIIDLCTRRIIQGKKINREEKILSLYEPDIHVISRGKAKGEVEFGNGLYIAEQSDGFIVDWEYSQDYPLPDHIIGEKSLDRIAKKQQQSVVQSYTGDRGFDTKEMGRYLDKNDIANNITPKNIDSLTKRLKDEAFVQKQKRRGQTEGRIGIVKNNYLVTTMRRKGFVNRQRSVALAMLAHNLNKCFLLYENNSDAQLSQIAV